MSKTTHFTVPPDRSAVSLFVGPNEFHDGDEYRNDGFVYEDGQRIRPYAEVLPLGGGDGFVWVYKMLPTAENVRALEALRWRLIQHWQKNVLPKLNAAADKLTGKGTVHHVHTKDPDYVLTYKRDNDGGVSMNVAKRPKKPNHPKLAAEFHQVKTWWGNNGTRQDKVNACFDRVIVLYVWQEFAPPTNANQYLHVTVNGRRYEFRSTWWGNGWHWQKGLWPEAYPVEVTI